MNKPLTIAHSNGQYVLVGAIQPIRETRTFIILGTAESTVRPLNNLTDSQIIKVLDACSDVGKILEQKGFKVIY